MLRHWELAPAEPPRCYTLKWTLMHEEVQHGAGQ